MKPSLQAQIRQVAVNLLYQGAGQVAEQTEGLWTEARAPPFEGGGSGGAGLERRHGRPAEQATGGQVQPREEAGTLWGWGPVFLRVEPGPVDLEGLTPPWGFGCMRTGQDLSQREQ